MALDPAWHELADEVAAQVLAELRENPPKITPWMNAAAAGEYIDVSVRGLESMRRAGRGPRYSRVGRVIVRYHIRHLDAWLNEHTVDTGGAK